VSQVLTIGVDDELVARFAAVCGGDVVALPADALSSGDHAGQLAGTATPALLVLGAEVSLEDAFAVAGQVSLLAPSTSVVMVAFADPELWLDAMRAGMRDVLSPHASDADVAAVFARAQELAAARRHLTGGDGAAAPDHRVIVVTSPKGGVGKTTVATNLAVGLAAAERGAAVIIDLDVQFGDVASALAIVPEYSLPDTVHGAASDDPLVLKTFLTRHPSGLHVVAGSDSPAAGDAVTAAQVSRLIATLSREFRYVVIDTAPGLTEHTLTALEQATDLVLLSGMDVPGIRGMRKELDVLTELALVPAGRHIVLNMADSGGALSMSDVQATIGAPVDLVLPRHAAVALSTNTGEPLLGQGSKDPVSKGLQGLVERFLPQARAQRSRFGRRRAGAR
jgi:pilus assembly protein CpaE